MVNPIKCACGEPSCDGFLAIDPETHSIYVEGHGNAILLYYNSDTLTLLAAKVTDALLAMLNEVNSSER